VTLNKQEVLSVKNLKKSFNQVTALDDFELSVREGELFGIVGPDGAGKTTAIKIFSGVEKKDSGNVKVLGYNIDTERDLINREIGYLSQKFSLYGDLTIDENIEFFAKIHGVKKYHERKEELLQFTRLTPFRNRLADKLSGGMRQKLALASTLIHSPKIIFLDEPTNGVDPVSRRDFWGILSALLKQGITVVISTPYLDETERCTKVALINKGKTLIQDTPMNIKEVIKENVFEIVCSPIREIYMHLKNKFPEMEIQMFGDRLNLLANISIEKIIVDITSQGYNIVNYRKILPSLENVFIHILTKTNEQ